MLGKTLSAFAALEQQWTTLKETHTDAASIIDAGLHKLLEYREHVEDIPAYLMAMGELVCAICTHGNSPLLALDPAEKLHLLEQHNPEQYQPAKLWFIELVCSICCSLAMIINSA